ncbi:polysaccharide deacetylase family protein [Dyella koreensis]|uniref:hypothetical protein n=1 Tax=Dyella koreensis TaxID=311235 RepID=UPI003619E3A4
MSRDEPFTEPADGQDSVVVPYMLRNNDILLIQGHNYFDQLYDEAATRCRMMSVSVHDRSREIETI